MHAEGVMAALKAGGWSVAEYGTTDGHTAEASRDGRRITVAAPSSALAWLALWRRVTERPLSGSAGREFR